MINQIKRKMRTISLKDVLIVMGMATTIALLTLVTEYVKTPPLGFDETSFNELDFAIVLAASLLFGIFLMDPVKILYGFIVSTSLSVVISVVFSSLYDLHVLGLGKIFSETVPGWEWEWITWFAFLRVFRIVFPAAIILIFFGGMIGGIVSEMMLHRG